MSKEGGSVCGGGLYMAALLELQYSNYKLNVWDYFLMWDGLRSWWEAVRTSPRSLDLILSDPSDVCDGSGLQSFLRQSLKSWVTGATRRARTYLSVVVAVLPQERLCARKLLTEKRPWNSVCYLLLRVFLSQAAQQTSVQHPQTSVTHVIIRPESNK